MTEKPGLLGVEGGVNSHVGSIFTISVVSHLLLADDDEPRSLTMGIVSIGTVILSLSATWYPRLERGFEEMSARLGGSSTIVCSCGARAFGER